MSQNIPTLEQLSAQNKQSQKVILKDISQTEETSQQNNSNVCLNDTDEKSSSQHEPLNLKNFESNNTKNFMYDKTVFGRLKNKFIVEQVPYNEIKEDHVSSKDEPKGKCEIVEDPSLPVFGSRPSSDNQRLSRSSVPCKNLKRTPIELIEGISLREKSTLLHEESLQKNEFGFCSEDIESEIEKALSSNKSRDFVGELKKSLEEIDEYINKENKMYEEKHIEKLKNNLEEANKNYKMASDEYNEFIISNPQLSYITQNDEKDAESNLKAVSVEDPRSSDASKVYWEKHNELYDKMSKTHNESIDLENRLKEFQYYKNNNGYINRRNFDRKLDIASGRYTTILKFLSIEPILEIKREEIRTELRQEYNSYIKLENEKYNKLYTDYIDSKNPFLEFPCDGFVSRYLNNKFLMEYEEKFSSDNINPDNNSSQKIYFEGLYTYENRVNIWEDTPLPEQNVNIIYYNPKYMLNQKYIKSFKYYVDDDDLSENYFTCSSFYKGLLSRSLINNLNDSFSKIFVDSSNRENLTNQLSSALNFITPGLSSLFPSNKNETLKGQGPGFPHRVSIKAGIRNPIAVVGNPENDFDIPKFGKYDESFYNGDSIAEQLIKKYFKEICSIFIFNLFLMSMKLNFNEMEKIMFKNIINKMFTEVLPEGKDVYRTLDYCLINLLKMDKSIIWILKLLTNYDVAINPRDKKALLACYPKNKNFIKILDKIPETNTISLFCTNISMEQIENIKQDEDELEQLENDCIEEDIEKEPVFGSLPSCQSHTKSDEYNYFKPKPQINKENSLLFLSINGIDLSLKCSFDNINISKNENGKFSINIE